MKHALLLAAGWFAFLGAQNMAPVSAPTPPSEHPPRLAAVDVAFVVAATQGNNAEVDAAKLALRRTSTDGVAAYARQMLTDHSEIAKDADLAMRHRMTPTTARLAAPDVLALQYLAHVEPVDFDQNYAMLQIGDHLAAQTAFATEARDGSDPQLRAFAQKWLPTIQAHLQLAITLVKHVGGDTPFKH